MGKFVEVEKIVGVDEDKDGKRNTCTLQQVTSANTVFNYYFLKKIRQYLLEDENLRNFLDPHELLWCDEIMNNFVVYVVPLKPEVKELNRYLGFLTSVDDRHRFDELMKAEEEKILQKICSISTIFDLITKSNSIIVGHNCLLDFMFVYSNFIRPLPGNFKLFFLSN